MKLLTDIDMMVPRLMFTILCASSITAKTTSRRVIPDSHFKKRYMRREIGEPRISPTLSTSSHETIDRFGAIIRGIVESFRSHHNDSISVNH